MGFAELQWLRQFNERTERARRGDYPTHCDTCGVKLWQSERDNNQFDCNRCEENEMMLADGPDKGGN